MITRKSPSPSTPRPRGRGQPAGTSGRGRGFNPDRREFNSHGERVDQGQSENPGQGERRFARELDSYYGRPRPQESREPRNRSEDEAQSRDAQPRSDSFPPTIPFPP